MIYKQLYKLMNYSLERSENPIYRRILSILLRFGIPFNSFHFFKLSKLNDFECSYTGTSTWLNQNHLGGFHACASLTIGELSAGTLLLKNFNPANYRLILKDIQCEYEKQVKGRVYTKITIDQQKRDDFVRKLQSEPEVFIKLMSQVFNAKNELIATIHTNWQLKAWNLVKKL